MRRHELVIIGGGPAGLSAAVSAAEAGAGDILILERERETGGILNQCIHNGFGLHTFQEELTGPEYAARYAKKAEAMPQITCLTDAMVIGLEEDHTVTAVHPEHGLMQISAGAVILAMGCRERPRGALNLPGFRPAGIYTAGTAQRLVNVDGKLPGKEVVILGSGDIGLIMARRMTLEGASVRAVAELMPYSGGLKRNIVQCLDDFGIPLKLSHTIVRIHGKERISGVTLARVDGHGKPVPGTEEEYSCDTLLLSVGLIPENELSREAGVLLNPRTGGPVVDESLQTSVDGIFACGNVLHVHDLVDFVSEEAAFAGQNAVRYLRQKARRTDPENSRRHGSCPEPVRIQAGAGVRYTVPSLVHPEKTDREMKIRFRAGGVYRDCAVVAEQGGKTLYRRRKKILVPGEMEEIVLRRELIGELPAGNITVRIEEE